MLLLLVMLLLLLLLFYFVRAPWSQHGARRIAMQAYPTRGVYAACGLPQGSTAWPP
jgi:hypothetical protein